MAEHKNERAAEGKPDDTLTKGEPMKKIRRRSRTGRRGAASRSAARSRGRAAPTPQGVAGGPRFAVDPFWPKPLKDNWIFGQVPGLTVDSRDHVWISHRPRTLLDDEKGAQKSPPATRCCTAPRRR